jgi:hypothetical protein
MLNRVANFFKHTKYGILLTSDSSTTYKVLNSGNLISRNSFLSTQKINPTKATINDALTIVNQVRGGNLLAIAIAIASRFRRILVSLVLLSMFL